MTHTEDPLVLYGQRFDSRLLLGTSRYPSPAVLARSVQVSQPAMLDAGLEWMHNQTTEWALRWGLRVEHEPHH